MRDKDKQVWLGLIALVGLLAPYSNAANAAENNLSSKQTVEVSAAPQGAFLVSKEEKLANFENKPSLTDLELKELLSLVGFKGTDLKEAWAIAKRESNGQPIRFNGNTKTGDNSYGLFQINMLGMLGPDRREIFNLDSNSDLLNPVINAQIAFHMSRGGEDWSSWKGMTPRAKMWLKEFPN